MWLEQRGRGGTNGQGANIRVGPTSACFYSNTRIAIEVQVIVVDGYGAGIRDRHACGESIIPRLVAGDRDRDGGTL